jgi:hypothetical protein
MTVRQVCFVNRFADFHPVLSWISGLTILLHEIVEVALINPH